MRTRAARTATAIAEASRDHALHGTTGDRTRDGAADDAATRSFSQLPKLVERAGTTSGPGSITGLYTVLVEGDDMNEPVADATRSSSTDIELSRKIAQRGGFVDASLLASCDDDERRARQLMATYRDAEDLISVGAYSRGPMPTSTGRVRSALQAYLTQPRGEVTSSRRDWSSSRGSWRTEWRQAVRPWRRPLPGREAA